MPIHPKTINIPAFKGINNVLVPERTPNDYLKEAENIDIDKAGGIHKRKGYSQIDSGDFHSLWADGDLCYAIKDGDLVKIDDEDNITVLDTGYGSNPVSFFRIHDSVYFSSISRNGTIESDTVRPWGIQQPNPLPDLSALAGSMLSGYYQVAISYVASDGRESGTTTAQGINLPNNSHILVSNIPTSSDASVTHVNIYMSDRDGEVMYLRGTVPNGTSTYDIYNDENLTQPLDVFNLYPAPLGHIIAEGHGRSWIAEDNFLWYSEPFSYEHFDYGSGWMQFPDRIRAVMPTEGGLWIAADKLYYMIGKDPDSSKLEEKEPIKVVEGSPIKIPGAYIFIENTPIGYKWLFTADKGIYVGFDDGITLNLTSQNYELPESDTGSAAFIQEDGINKYISMLKKPRSDSENAAVGDLVTGTIIRNGVVLTE